MKDEVKTYEDPKNNQVFRRFRLGEHLLQRKIINLPQLFEALDEQEKTDKLIGEILVSKGYLSYEQLIETLDGQNKADKLILKLLINAQEK